MKLLICTEKIKGVPQWKFFDGKQTFYSMTEQLRANSSNYQNNNNNNNKIILYYSLMVTFPLSGSIILLAFVANSAAFHATNSQLFQ